MKRSCSQSSVVQQQLHIHAHEETSPPSSSG